MTTRRLVLFSGGLKSTFLAALAKREGEAVLLHFLLYDEDIGREEGARLVSTALGFEHILFKDLRTAPPLKEVLNKMLYLVLQALPFAKEYYCAEIYYGLSKDDDPKIVRVVEPFAKQLNDLLVLAQPLYDGRGGWLGGVELGTPLRRLDRARVIRLGREFDIPWELTQSCKHSTAHCGKCKGCIRRRKAFLREGHVDPTIYTE